MGLEPRIACSLLGWFLYDPLRGDSVGSVYLGTVLMTFFLALDLEETPGGRGLRCSSILDVSTDVSMSRKLSRSLLLSSVSIHILTALGGGETVRWSSNRLEFAEVRRSNMSSICLASLAGLISEGLKFSEIALAFRDCFDPLLNNLRGRKKRLIFRSHTE